MSKEVEQNPNDDVRKPPTPESFITEWPLYTPFETPVFQAPKRISFHCNGPDCSKETTWVLSHSDWVLSDPRFCHVHYECSLCQDENLVVMYREFRTVRNIIGSNPNVPTHQITVLTAVQKIGQLPAISISIPKTLQKALGESAAALYKKSLVCRNEGYGLAAVTYIRRVVEDETDELIEVVSQLAASHNVEPKIIEQIRAAKEERTTYDNKLKIAATVLPDSLVVDGVNPLGELYSLVSAGVHDLTEEQCIAVADETKSVFEFAFTNLRAETKTRLDFVSKVKKWAGKKKFTK